MALWVIYHFYTSNYSNCTIINMFFFFKMTLSGIIRSILLSNYIVLTSFCHVIYTIVNSEMGFLYYSHVISISYSINGNNKYLITYLETEIRVKDRLTEAWMKIVTTIKSCYNILIFLKIQFVTCKSC